MTTPSEPVNIDPLAVRVAYLRRPTAVSMFFSLAQQALKFPELSWEQVTVHLTGDGDYKALIIRDHEVLSE